MSQRNICAASKACQRKRNVGNANHANAHFDEFAIKMLKENKALKGESRQFASREFFLSFTHYLLFPVQTGRISFLMSRSPTNPRHAVGTIRASCALHFDITSPGSVPSGVPRASTIIYDRSNSAVIARNVIYGTSTLSRTVKTWGLYVVSSLLLSHPMPHVHCSHVMESLKECLILPSRLRR